MMKRGFTLVELIVTMVVIAIIMYSVMAIFINSGAKGVNVEVFTVAQSLAEGKLEQAMARNFEDIAGESETSFSGDLSSYSFEIVVDYVSAEDLDFQLGSATDYKKIKVKIRHPQLGNPILLESLRADY